MPAICSILLTFGIVISVASAIITWIIFKVTDNAPEDGGF